MITQTKTLYTIPIELIIVFEIGVNYANKTVVNFPQLLDVRIHFHQNNIILLDVQIEVILMGSNTLLLKI